MYTKIDLIENKKLEKIIRENKYRTRISNNKKAQKQRLANVFEKVFCIVFWTFMIYFIYQVISYLYIRL